MIANDLDELEMMAGADETLLPRISCVCADLPRPDRTSQIANRLLAILPWGHTAVLPTKLDHDDQRLAHPQAALSQGWSRGVRAFAITFCPRDGQ